MKGPTADIGGCIMDLPISEDIDAFMTACETLQMDRAEMGPTGREYSIRSVVRKATSTQGKIKNLRP